MEIKSTSNESSGALEIPELHLTDVILFFKRHFIVLAIITAVGGGLGVLYSFTLEKTYTATTTLLPEYSAARPSFFSMAVGAGSGEGTGPLTPELYPSILQTTSFGKHLLTLPIIAGDGVKFKTLKDFLQKPAKKSFLNFGSDKEVDKKVSDKKTAQIELPQKAILNLSREEEGLIGAAKGLASAVTEQKNGLIVIQSEMNDPIVAAQIVEYSKVYLTNYIEDFRVAKLINQMEFLETRVAESKKREKAAEMALNSYRDSNRGTFLNVARITELRLQSEYTLAQSIYSDLVVKLEQIKIKVKEERPVFNVLEPTKVPIDKTNPKRMIIGGIGAILAFIFTLFFILFFKEKVHLFFLKKA